MPLHEVHATPDQIQTMRTMFADGEKLDDVAAAIGRCTMWVRKECKRLRIERPKRGDFRRFRPSAEEERAIRAMKEAGARQVDIEAALGWNHWKLHRACKRLGIVWGKGGGRPGDRHHQWTGGRIVDKSGYILVYCPDHPHGSGSRGRYVREHRLVMERVLGRYLEPHEVVHHKNGDRQDNRPENLELFASNADHLRHELTGKCPKWTPEGRARSLRGLEKWRSTRRQKR